MTFWIVTALITLSISVLFFLVILRARSTGEPAAAYDLRLYRQQLKEVDRDLARGVIQESDAERIRTEVSRRILAADAALKKHSEGSAQPRVLSIVAGGGVCVLMLGGAFGLYLSLGAPGYGDLGLDYRLALAAEHAANRPDQAQMEAEAVPFDLPAPDAAYVELVERLREAAASRPTDSRGQGLLALHEARLGNFTKAYQAKAKYIDLSPGVATAEDYAEQAELMVLAAGGLVSPETEEVLKQALTLDPRNGTARYYWGLMMGQNGRPDIAFGIWRDTLVAGPAGAPWIEAIRAQITDMAFRAGQEVDPALLSVQPPSGQPGPTQEQMQAASEMSPEEQQEMIRGMVEGLSDRLANEGGTAPEWARLISALTVLGDVERANRIYAEAQSRFADAPEQAAIIDAAARQAGLITE
ncbi:c-type cytochrome biogenesis protein CcmI [Epibacterium sp. SM1979]|uniref:C-type cytochrome biogenesis protein CcmI n=1 Tax=Tritonibacter litoralis TaxID=2662264 RepID=A0A843YBJ5_9RHOB|nr:c-type cytochrome biogenesis protein CcmI [Tritonibacter litoralis]MQQ06844.1 c-type cytochrome biogenesis protein CcmI [Tritonibacter litoralis]